MPRSRRIASGTALPACPDFLRGQFRRRSLLQAGALSCLGLGLEDWFHAARAQDASGGGRAKPAKACIFMFMWGGPSQLDTFDMKPDAPQEVARDVSADLHERAGHADLRALHSAGEADR